MEQTEQGQGWMTHSREAGSARTALACSLPSLSTGKPEARHWAALLCSTWQGPGAEVQGEVRVVLLDKRDACRYKRYSGGFGGGGVREQTDGGVREQKLSEATQELVDIWA